MSYKSHELPICQVEKGVYSDEMQGAGNNLALAHLNFLKARYPSPDTILTCLDGRQYQLHEVWHCWLHVMNRQVIFNYGEEKD